MSKLEELIFVRHGETTGESSIRLVGSTDVELNDFGRTQMACVGAALSPVAFDTIVASPLVRSRESAEIIADSSDLEIVTHEAFREVDFGDWEGMTLEEIAKEDPDNYARFLEHDVDFRFPAGESRAEFRHRVEVATVSLLDEHEGRLLAVLHKGVMKVLLGVLLELPQESYLGMPMELGSIHRTEKYRGRWRLVSCNEVTHLGEHRSRTKPI